MNLNTEGELSCPEVAGRALSGGTSARAGEITLDAGELKWTCDEKDRQKRPCFVRTLRVYSSHMQDFSELFR